MTCSQLPGVLLCLLACSCTEPRTEASPTAELAKGRAEPASKPVAGTDSLAEDDLPWAGCPADFVYEVREPAVAGQANVFVGVANWDAATDACWYSLSEYYHNIAPDSSVALQKAYFISEPAKQAITKVTKWSQMTAEVKKRVIGRAVYDRKADTLFFEEAPFKNRSAKRYSASTRTSTRR